MLMLRAIVVCLVQVVHVAVLAQVHKMETTDKMVNLANMELKGMM